MDLRQVGISRTAGAGAILIAVLVSAYALYLLVVGAPWSVVPGTRSGTPTPGTDVLIPAAVEPVLIVITTASAVIVGVGARLRGNLWGLYLAAVGAVGLTIFGAIFIFGPFGLTFITGVALLAFIAVFGWFGRDTGAEMD